MTVDRSMDANLLEAHTETVIGEAQAMADLEKIDTVFVTAPKRGGDAGLHAAPKIVAPNER